MIFIILQISNPNRLMISRLSIALEKETLRDFHSDLQIPDELTNSDRVRPKDTVQIYVQGELVDADWGLIPSTADNDLQQFNRIGVLTKDLSHSHTYRLIARRNRGLLWAKAFFHNTVRAGTRTQHKFSLRNGSQFAIPLIFDLWQEAGRETNIRTFSLLHQVLSTSDTRIPSLLPIILQEKRDMETWLDLEHKPSSLHWPDFEKEQFIVQSREMDVKMRPSFKAVYPTDELPDYLNNIA